MQTLRKDVGPDFAISIHCIVGFWKGAIRITTIHSKQVFGFWLGLKESLPLHTGWKTEAVRSCVLCCSHQFVRFSVLTAYNKVMNEVYRVCEESKRRMGELHGQSMRMMGVCCMAAKTVVAWMHAAGQER